MFWQHICRGKGNVHIPFCLFGKYVIAETHHSALRIENLNLAWANLWFYFHCLFPLCYFPSFTSLGLFPFSQIALFGISELCNVALLFVVHLLLYMYEQMWIDLIRLYHHLTWGFFWWLKEIRVRTNKNWSDYHGQFHPNKSSSFFHYTKSE